MVVVVSLLGLPEKQQTSRFNTVREVTVVMRSRIEAQRRN